MASDDVMLHAVAVHVEPPCALRGTGARPAVLHARASGQTRGMHSATGLCPESTRHEARHVRFEFASTCVRVHEMCSPAAYCHEDADKAGACRCDDVVGGGHARGPAEQPRLHRPCMQM